MLYLVTYPDWEGHWHKYYNRAVCKELQKCDMRYHRIVTNYYSESIHPTLQRMQSMKSRPDDAWFFSTAHNPAIELVEQKPGLKYGHVHSLECLKFETARLQGISLQERRRLGFYDRVFFSSRWALTQAQQAYPQYADHFVLTGFPMDYEIYQPYRQMTAQPDLVVFNQRLACERLAPLEIELASRLINRGYTVQHLYASGNGLAWTGCPLAGQLRQIGEESGMQFIPNRSKFQYHVNLGGAGCVVTTSVCDNLPVALIEGIRLGAVPVAPNCMCFPEFVHPDNLYSPYDLAEIEKIVQQAPRRVHSIDQYAGQIVIQKYLRAMRLSGYSP